MDRPAQEKKLNVIARNAKRLKLLTDDILHVTKIEGQALQLKKELINVNHIISGTVEKIKNQIDHHENIELVFNSLATSGFLLQSSKVLLYTHRHKILIVCRISFGTKDYSAQSVFNSRLVSVTGMKDFGWQECRIRS